MARHDKDVSLDHSFLGTSFACLPIGPHADPHDGT